MLICFCLLPANGYTTCVVIDGFSAWNSEYRWKRNSM